MKKMNVQNLRTRWQEVPGKRALHIFKTIIMIGLSAGLVVFFFLGKEFALNSFLLDADALKEIRDNSIDRGAFFQYVLARRLLAFAAGVLAWWWGFGKLYLYGVIGGCSFVMGACFYISLVRYPFTGLFLWFFLYFPHMIFYAAALFCGMILAAGVFRTRVEKVKYLWQNGVLVFVIVLVYVVGIYCESYLNVPLLQNFLEYF